MKQTTAKLVDVVYFLMKIKREDELIALINFVSRRDMRDINKIWRNTTPDLDNDNGDEKKARARAQAQRQHRHRAQRGCCYKCGRRGHVAAACRDHGTGRMKTSTVNSLKNDANALTKACHDDKLSW